MKKNYHKSNLISSKFYQQKKNKQKLTTLKKLIILKNLQLSPSLNLFQFHNNQKQNLKTQVNKNLKF